MASQPLSAIPERLKEKLFPGTDDLQPLVKAQYSLQKSGATLESTSSYFVVEETQRSAYIVSIRV